MIRKIMSTDRERFISMARAFYHSPAVHAPVPEDYHRRAFEEMLRSEDYLLGLIFETDGQTAGYALLMKSWSQEAGGPCVWIDELYVLPEFQGRGLGHEFFRELPKRIPAARYRLEIEPENHRAEALYRKMGFENLPYGQMVRDLGPNAE